MTANILIEILKIFELDRIFRNEAMKLHNLNPTFVKNQTKKHGIIRLYLNFKFL